MIDFSAPTKTSQVASTDKPIKRFLAQLKGYREYSRGYNAHCPAHKDRNSSLMVWEDETDQHVGVKCFAGCSRTAVCEALGLAETDLYIPNPKRNHQARQVPLQLLDLAADKLIHPNFLLTLGIEETKDGVKIPYRTPDGQEYARYRLRSALVAKDGSLWGPSGDKHPIIPYGLDRLDKAREAGYLVIVEGESDCWTLWQHKQPALGLPGATMVDSTLQAEYLPLFPKCVYVIKEPDAAGQAFPQKVVDRLKKLKYTGKIYAVDLQQLTGAGDPNDLHKKDLKAFKATFQKALDEALVIFNPRNKPTIFRACDLQQKVFAPTKWAVPDILPEGVTILAGKPKLGKSWLALGLLTAIAAGGVALGNTLVEAGEVLYIALEDGEKRLNKRLNVMTGGALVSPNFFGAAQWPRINEGGLEELEEWMQEHPLTRLICIDTWASFKPHSNGRKQLYDEDYEGLSPLQQFAQRHSISVVVVDHMRKQESEDPLDMITSSTGKTGAVDGFLLLFKKRGETDARLFVMGRDIEEEQEYMLSFERECASWVIKGDADVVAGTPQRQAILDILMAHEAGLKCKEIADKLEKNPNTIKNLLVALRNENKVILQNNLYHIPSHSSQPSYPSHPSHPSQEASTDYATDQESGSADYGKPSADYAADYGLIRGNQPLKRPEAIADYADYGNYANHRKPREPMPNWYIPGTRDYEKFVATHGQAEVEERRAAWIAQQAQQSGVQA